MNKKGQIIPLLWMVGLLALVVIAALLVGIGTSPWLKTTSILFLIIILGISQK